MDKNAHTTFTVFENSKFSIEELKEAIIVLERAKASKEDLKKELTKIITFLASRIDYEVFETEMLPEGKIYIGKGKPFDFKMASPTFNN